jgi:sugar-specific transcriptional regulator TrmB/DNA-binding CsgD family transcriptional regulator
MTWPWGAAPRSPGPLPDLPPDALVTHTLPMLGVLGLSPDEEAVYRLLVGRATATASELATASGLPESAVDRALGRLVERGLATRLDERFAAAPPAVALGSLISERRAGLQAAELALVALAEEHRAAAAGRTIDEVIEVVTGVEAIRHRFLQVLQAARGQVRTFVTAPFVAVPPGENPAEDAAVARGVRFRAVVDKHALAQPGAVAETVSSLRNGVEVRVVESLAIKLVLADADLALVPLTVSAGAEPGAVLLHRSGLLGALDALFENVWRDAYPLRLSGEDTLAEAPAEGVTGLDRKILALLLSGLTDQAVAAQLDLSLRTLQRRLRHLMDLAGAESRMQLGWHAARNGWA